jgi:hypothetical protein
MDVRVVYDADEVTVFVSGMGVLGFGDTLEAAAADLIAELEDYAARFFADEQRYLATNRRDHADALRRFAEADAVGKMAILGLDDTTSAAPGSMTMVHLI